MCAEDNIRYALKAIELINSLMHILAPYYMLSLQASHKIVTYQIYRGYFENKSSSIIVIQIMFACEGIGALEKLQVVGSLKLLYWMCGV